MVGIRSIPLALLTLALLPASAAATPTTQIIVKREPGLSGAERADIRADADVRFVETLPLPSTEVVAAEPGDVSDALRDLNADPDVVYAERDRADPRPPPAPTIRLPYSGGSRTGPTSGQFGGGLDADTDAPEAWARSTGARSDRRRRRLAASTLAHPDLTGQVVGGLRLRRGR